MTEAFIHNPPFLVFLIGMSLLLYPTVSDYWNEPNSEVLFTNVDGEVFRYRVVSVETLAPTQVEDMTRSSDKWDLTLFTCTPGGGSRCTVRCVRDTQ